MEFNFSFCISLYLKSHIHPLELDNKKEKTKKRISYGIKEYF